MAYRMAERLRVACPRALCIGWLSMWLGIVPAMTQGLPRRTMGTQHDSVLADSDEPGRAAGGN